MTYVAIQEEKQAARFKLNKKTLQELTEFFQFHFDSERLRKKCLNLNLEYEYV